MKVHELIGQLQKLDQEMDVIYVNDGCGWADGNALVKDVQVSHQVDDWSDNPSSNERVNVVVLIS